MTRPLIKATLGAVVAIAASPAFADSASLATYVAEYNLTLAETASDQDVAGVTGLIVLEFTGSSCAGYTNDGRIVTAIDTFEGERIVTDSRTRTVERPGGAMEFTSETFAAGTLIENSSGTAVRENGELRVELSEPATRSLKLESPAVYPTEQVVQVLEAARSGTRFVAMDVYDGSQDGSLVFQTATVIGNPTTERVDNTEQPFLDENGMSGQRYWPVSISYFEMTDAQTDATPDFTMSFLLYDNGISRSFMIDYGSFAMEGMLSRLEMIAPEACD